MKKFAINEYDKYVKKISEIGKKRFELKKNHEKVVKEVLENGLSADALIDGMIKFEDLLDKGKRSFSIESYIKAIEFCSYVVSGMTYKKAYSICFPDRVKGKNDNFIAASCAQYSNSILVSNMLARVYLNQHIFFIDKVLRSKMKLYEIGMDEMTSPKVRVDALDKFITHTKKDEDKAGIDIQVNIQNNSIDILDKKLDELASMASASIKLGSATPKDIIEANYTQVGSNE